MLVRQHAYVAEAETLRVLAEIGLPPTSSAELLRSLSCLPDLEKFLWKLPTEGQSTKHQTGDSEPFTADHAHRWLFLAMSTSSRHLPIHTGETHLRYAYTAESATLQQCP